MKKIFTFILIMSALVVSGTGLVLAENGVVVTQSPDTQHTVTQEPDIQQVVTQSPSNETTQTSSNSSMIKLVNPLKFDSVGEVIKAAVDIFTFVAILFAVIVLVYIGFRLIMIQGDAAKAGKLKEWLMWAIVGIAIIIGARVIIDVVVNTLDAANVVDEQVIESVKKANSR